MSGSSRRLKSVVADCLLLVWWLAISYLGLEVVYRIYLFLSIRHELIERYDLGSTDGLHVFDPRIGYRRTPNTAWENTGGYLRNRYRVNEHGLIANDIDTAPYPVAKPDGEYRIALLGDSMTAGDANYLRWADLLQDYLNRAPRWREFVGGRFTRVINFGMGGTGFVQWGPKYEFDAHRFAPDLVIVWFIVDDIMRKFVQSGRLQFTSDEERRDYLKKRVTANMLGGMPWVGWYPELHAATVGRWFGMTTRLTVAAAVSADRATHFQSQKEGIATSLAALERIRCLNPNMVIVHHAEYEEFLQEEDNAARWATAPYLQGLISKFLAAAAARGFAIVDLTKIYPAPKSRPDIDSLFNLPLDTHNSDYGVFVYAGWAYRYLLDWSANPSARAPRGPMGCE